MDLKSVADDLTKFLAKDKVEAKATPPEVLSGEITEDLTPKVMRTAFNYVLTMLEDTDSADAIGKSFMVGAAAIANDTGLDPDEVSEAMIAFLEDIVTSAKEMA